jgi:hypothetical protein
MGAEVQAWERQPSEDDEAWKAFQSYRDQTPPRRAHQAAVKRTEMLSRWYNDHAWAERVAAYDRHLDAIRRETREALLKEDERDRAARQLAHIKGMQDIVDLEIAKLSRDARSTEAFGLVKVSELNKLMSNIIQCERLIRGQSTENVGVLDADLENLTPDELRQLSELRKKMTKKTEGEGE